MWKKLLLFGLASLAVFTVGILIGHFGIKKNNSKSLPDWIRADAQDVDENLLQMFINEVDSTQLKENLRVLSRVPHMATTAGDEKTVEFVLQRWQDPKSGLDAAWREDYSVYLSFPNKDMPNKVTVVTASDEVQFTVREKEKSYTPDQDDPDVVQPFAAYGPAGNVKGKLVYANQGKESDYKHLNDTLGSLVGTIAIVRYGGAGRSAKAINAAPYGVAGVLVYTEPYDMNDGLMSEADTYPNSWYLPPTGVERGSYMFDFGDPLTPYLAAKKDTYRTDVKDIKGVPPIPIQPIGFEDAKELICELDGVAAPADWQGSFPCTYKIGGPGFVSTSKFKDCDVNLNIYNKGEIKESANVMGVIWGSVEPDRYVMYGNHRDSWVHGAVDPSSGTAVMLEITRLLGQNVKAGKWRPRRTIIFGSWGAEEFGLMGSVEFAEEYISKLSQRAVTYINVDISVFANATLSASSTPMGQHALFTASKQVKIPGSNTVSVYDNWMRYANRTSATHGRIPDMRYLTGAGSDYAAFIHYLGITSYDISYTYDKSKTRARIYPAYHTAYDTFDYVEKYIDPGFTSHQAVARTAGNLLIRLADSVLLPYNCSDYAETLELYLKTAEQNLEADLNANNIDMNSLKEAVKSFRTAAQNLDRTIHNTDFVNSSPLKARMINDKLMLLERSFLNPQAFPDKYGFRHVIWTSRSSSVVTFPGLADAVEKAKASSLKEDWAQAHKHLSIVTQAISGAAHTLIEAHSEL